MDHSIQNVHDIAAITGFDYTLAFIAGVLGSGHCLGMCGALVSGYFMNAGNNKSYLPYFAYQFSRVFVYVGIGLVAASLGVVLVSGGVFGKIQSLLQMGIGFVVVILGLGIIGLIPWQGSVKLLPMGLLQKGYSAARTKGPLVGAMIAGFINGFMPCPLTFAMYVEATAATTVIEGGQLLLAFGLGTLPTMLLISMAFGKMSSSLRGLMLKGAALTMIIMGINTIFKGFTFFQQEDFKHRTFLYFLKQKIDDLIMLMGQIIEYINMMMSNLHGL